MTKNINQWFDNPIITIEWDVFEAFYEYIHEAIDEYFGENKIRGIKFKLKRYTLIGLIKPELMNRLALEDQGKYPDECYPGFMKDIVYDINRVYAICDETIKNLKLLTPYNSSFHECLDESYSAFKEVLRLNKPNT